MSSVNIFIPLILIIIFALVARWGIQAFNRRFRAHMNVKRTTWLLVGYGAVLLIAMGMSYVVSLASAANAEIPYEELEKEYQAFYEAAHRGNIDEIRKYSVMEKKWDFPYAEKGLKIVKTDNEHYLWLIVERKQENDGLIEATMYRSRAVTSSEGAYTIDFTDKIPPSGIELSDGTMTITKPEPVELNFAAFKKEFTINQFTGEGGRGFGSATYWGQNVLYLQIPKDLQLVTPENVQLIYIGD